MMERDAEGEREGSVPAPGSISTGDRRGWDLFWTAVGFGLAFGLLELAFLSLRVWLQDDGFYLRSRHFIWMVPTSVLVLFAAMGAAAVPLARILGGSGPRFVLGACLFLGFLGQFMLIRGVNSIACALMAGGLAYRGSSWLAARPEGLRRWVRRGGPVLATALVALLASAFLDSARGSVQRRAAGGASRGKTPNVLLIVLDTVRADRLSLYGHFRDTTPNLKRFAERGGRFDQARAPSSWTLPSHASMFTGRWPSELGVERRGWLDRAHPTLAERLRDSGYATAGFVANPFFCGWESGLSRGFQSYADYPVTAGEVFRSSTVGWFLARGERRLRFLLGLDVDSGAARDVDLDFSRKHATQINREFLAWLSRNGSRPFFAFLNFFDAHDPYLLPPGAVPRFRSELLSHADLTLLRDWLQRDRDSLTPSEIQVAIDAYDECVAELDHQIGALLDALEARGVLDETLVIITSDHGEQFGEHGHFGHGLTLFDEETRVPLLLSLPGRVPAGRVIKTPVTLADLPATVLDLLGMSADSPFPGASLSSTWADAPANASPAYSELLARIDAGAFQKNQDPANAWRSLVLDNYSLILRGDGHRMLYDLANDPGQTEDLDDDPDYSTVLESHRGAVEAAAGELGRQFAAPETQGPKMK